MKSIYRLPVLLCLLFVSFNGLAQDPMYEEASSDKADPELHKRPLPINKETGKIEFQKVVEVPGKTQAEIYALTREWFAKAFVSANAVLQMDDREAGVLVGRGVMNKSMFPTAALFLGVVQSTEMLLKVESKDGRYRYTLTDIVIDLTTSETNMKYPAEDIISDKALYKSNGGARSRAKKNKEAILTDVDNLTSSLEGFVKGAANSSDW